MGHIVPAEFDTTWATYTEEFRALRLPALLVAMMGNLVVLVIIAIKGHESRAVRRLGIGLGLGGIAIMTWCVVDGASLCWSQWTRSPASFLHSSSSLL